MSTAVRSALVVLILIGCSLAQDPCAGQHARALVLGGGGSKGAFEAGAAYHLIVDRGCDFTEFSGTSVGALNSALLAQAARSDDPQMSSARMQAQADALVAMYRSIKGTKDVMKGRPLASLRFGLFGLEAMKNFAPMRKLLAANFSIERLDKGRQLRVGAISFHDGAYREVVLNGETNARALDFIFGSAMIPMFGTMPRIAPEAAGTEVVQFGDGSLRHMSGVSSYFVVCASGAMPSACRKTGNHGVPPHPRIEQVFAVVTSPYARDNETRPVIELTMFKPGTRQITDGRKVMSRALDLILDSVHHDDLDSLLLGNDLLRWRDQAADAAKTPGFPLESFNFDPQQPDAPARAYQVGIVAPAVADNGLQDTLDFSPKRLATNLYCGCVAADAMMRAQFGLASMKDKCRAHFGAYDEHEACHMGASEAVASKPAAATPGAQ